jgi:superfamily II DNA or RNA helicase
MSDLLVYQKPHVEKLIKAISKYHVAIDASDTGTGKTYCALYCAKLLGFKPLIICPKAVLTSWKRVARSLDVEIEFITNYDQIISSAITNTRQQEQIMRAMGLILDNDNVAEPNVLNVAEPNVLNVAEPNVLNVAEPNVLNVAEPNIYNPTTKSKKTKSKKSEVSKLEEDSLSTKSKSTKSKSTKSKSTKSTGGEQDNFVNSATNKPYLKYCHKVFETENNGNNLDDIDNGENIIVDQDDPDINLGGKIEGKFKPKVKTFNWTLPEKTLLIFDEVHRCKNIKTLHFKILASIKPYLCPNIKCLVLSATVADKIKYFAPIGYILGWINDCSKYAVWLNRKAHDTGFPKSKTLHHLIFPFHGSRMKISELGNLFPRNQVITECYDMENAKEIEAQYEIIKKCIEDLRQKKNDTGCILARITRARQMIELLKYPTFCELIEDHLDSGLNVVVFVNYTDTLNKLAKTFETGSVIHGQQTETERNKIIDAFQRNETNLIIANIKAGGVGISLHDIHGNHQRVSIISPTWSAQDTVQTIGRIHRAEGKTPALQKFIFCAGTIEEYICDKLREKLDTLSTINDGILHPYSNLMIVPDSDDDDNSDSNTESDNDSSDDEDDIKKNQIENLNKTSKKVKQNSTQSNPTQSNPTQSNPTQSKTKRKVKNASEYLDV